MRAKRIQRTMGMYVLLLSSTMFGFGGCGSSDLLKYFSRNACNFLNCDVLFWVEDIFPLSERPMMGGAAASGGAAEEEEEMGGH